MSNCSHTILQLFINDHAYSYFLQSSADTSICITGIWQLCFGDNKIFLILSHVNPKPDWSRLTVASRYYWLYSQILYKNTWWFVLSWRPIKIMKDLCVQNSPFSSQCCHYNSSSRYVNDGSSNAFRFRIGSFFYLV